MTGSPDERTRTAAPTVGAVVVNHDGGYRILRVLAALHRQRHPLEKIIVVDNDSADGSRERIERRFPGVRVLALGANRGVAIARNEGLRALDTTLALLLDHDVYVQDGCIQRLVEACVEHRATVACPRIRLIPERDVVQADGAALHFLGTQILRHGYERVGQVPDEPGAVDSCIGACMLVDRAKALEAGGFDELFFFYFEDLEFSMRLRASGHTIWCDPAALVFHERANGTPDLSFRGNGRYPPARAYFTMRNRLLSMLIHYRMRTLLMLSPALLLHEFASFALAAHMGWPREWLRSWAWVVRNRRTIADRRRRMQRLRSIDDRDLLVGGTPPLAPFLLCTSSEKRLVGWYSTLVNGYWRFARHAIG